MNVGVSILGSYICRKKVENTLVWMMWAYKIKTLKDVEDLSLRTAVEDSSYTKGLVWTIHPYYNPAIRIYISNRTYHWNIKDN